MKKPEVDRCHEPQLDPDRERYFATVAFEHDFSCQSVDESFGRIRISYWMCGPGSMPMALSSTMAYCCTSGSGLSMTASSAISTGSQVSLSASSSASSSSST